MVTLVAMVEYVAVVTEANVTAIGAGMSVFSTGCSTSLLRFPIATIATRLYKNISERVSEVLLSAKDGSARSLIRHLARV